LEGSLADHVERFMSKKHNVVCVLNDVFSMDVGGKGASDEVRRRLV
jgi:hypothetical protein